MLLLTPSQSTLDYYSTSLSSLGNATAESPLSFQHLGVHWGRSAPRLWLHHRSRPPAGWFCDGIRFLWAQPCSAKCQIFKDSQATYATFFLSLELCCSGYWRKPHLAIWCHLVPVHQASCLHPPVPAHHGWWCPSRLCQRPCAKNWSRCGLGVSNGAFHKWMGTKKIKWMVYFMENHGKSIYKWMIWTPQPFGNLQKNTSCPTSAARKPPHLKAAQHTSSAMYFFLWQITRQAERNLQNV